MEAQTEELFAVEVRHDTEGWLLLTANGRKCLFVDVAEANDVACREGLLHPSRVVRFSRDGAVSKFPKVAV